MVGKLAINKNKYNLFAHDLETKTDNLIINIGADLGFDIDQKHELKLTGGLVNKKYNVGLAYKFNW